MNLGTLADYVGKRVKKPKLSWRSVSEDIKGKKKNFYQC